MGAAPQPLADGLPARATPNPPFALLVGDAGWARAAMARHFDEAESAVRRHSARPATAHLGGNQA